MSASVRIWTELGRRKCDVDVVVDLEIERSIVLVELVARM